jgi:MinD superfamily P-loop ATPase
LLVDCDVECPNDYLLTSQKLEQPVHQTFALLPELKQQLCKQCGLCVRTCPKHAIFKPQGGYPQFLDDLCISCGICWGICSENAITQRKKPTGEIFFNVINEHLSLITGRMFPGIVESSAIVQETVHFAKEYLQNEDDRIVIYDTAAGTHCTVIQALLPAEQILVVTEPTPLGHHDAEIMLQVLQELQKKKVSLIVNQADLGSKDLLHSLVVTYGISIAFEVMFSKEIVQAYSDGTVHVLEPFFQTNKNTSRLCIS